MSIYGLSAYSVTVLLLQCMALGAVSKIKTPPVNATMMTTKQLSAFSTDVTGLIQWNTKRVLADVTIPTVDKLKKNTPALSSAKKLNVKNTTKSVPSTTLFKTTIKKATTSFTSPTRVTKITPTITKIQIKTSTTSTKPNSYTTTPINTTPTLKTLQTSNIRKKATIQTTPTTQTTSTTQTIKNTQTIPTTLNTPTTTSTKTTQTKLTRPTILESKTAKLVTSKMKTKVIPIESGGTITTIKSVIVKRVPLSPAQVASRTSNRAPKRRREKARVRYISDFKLHTEGFTTEIISHSVSMARAEKKQTEVVREETIADEPALTGNVAAGSDFIASAQNEDVAKPRNGNSGAVDMTAFLPDDQQLNLTRCEPGFNDECDVNNYERCSTKGRCICLQGYLPDRQTGTCVAAQFFRGEITFANKFSESLNDTNSDEYVKFNSEIRQVLYSAFSNQRLKGILDVYIISFDPDSNKAVFEVALDKNSSPRREKLQTMYNRGLTAVAYVDTDRLVKLTGTGLILGKNASMSQYLQLLTEYSHCVDANHNYCDMNARCTHRMRTFSCRCQDGFDDISPDVFKTPGEVCRFACKCKNNGTCEVVEGAETCSCPNWFIGSNCEINGKELLIICASVLGGLLILTVLMCFICICTMRKRSRSSRSSAIGMGSNLDTSVVKLPRVWMDGSRPYEVPPRDTRRWSYVSEPIRYIDEYMMDDYVHAETLPLPRHQDGNKKRYYNAYQNSGYNGYSSSTLSVARPKYRH
ncbi:hypothetical protein SNE40_018320 [Patella caerulea]|uniref:Uncharacterized protein n=1 Tax=Patella caerulea TaxID=87958 RepID=A0AAN8P6Z3_PATCE